VNLRGLAVPVLCLSLAGSARSAEPAEPDPCAKVERDQHAIWKSLVRLRPMGALDFPAIQLEPRDAFLARRTEEGKAFFDWVKFQALALGLIRGEQDQAAFVRAYASVPTGEVRRGRGAFHGKVLTLDPKGEAVHDQELPSVIVSCPSPDAWDVATHEAFHWIQGQRWPALRSRLSGSDRILARSALIEGDASLMGMMLSSSLPFARFADHARRAAQEISRWKDLSSFDRSYLRLYLPEVPSSLLRRDGSVYVVRDMFFRHVHGRIFVQEAWRRGGAKTVDALYDSPERWPASTEQILHPEKYFDRERLDTPREIPRVGDIEGRTPFQEDVLGEWMIYAWLAAYLPPAEARRASEGWGGDRLAIDVRPGRLSSRLQTVWDSARDAEEFAQALRRLFAIRLGQEGALRSQGPGRFSYQKGDRRVSLRLVGTSVDLAEEMPCAFCEEPETIRERAIEKMKEARGGRRP
jgi:hypothetical protein